MGQAIDPVQAFLRRKTFHCQYLNANLTAEECCVRQKREVTEKRYGRKITLNNDPQSRHCRSGECKQGLVQLGKVSARKAKARKKARQRREARV